MNIPNHLRVRSRLTRLVREVICHARKQYLAHSTTINWGSTSDPINKKSLLYKNLLVFLYNISQVCHDLKNIVKAVERPKA